MGQPLGHHCPTLDSRPADLASQGPGAWAAAWPGPGQEGDRVALSLPSVPAGPGQPAGQDHLDSHSLAPQLWGSTGAVVPQKIWAEGGVP